MNYDRLSEIIVQELKSALEQPIYRFGLPTKKGDSNKISTGSLRDSIRAIPSDNGIDVEMNVYGQYLQGGKDPGKYVPLNPLEDWIKSRGISFKDKNGKSISTRGMAAIISRHIHRWGIPSEPRWMDVAFAKILQNKEVEEILGETTFDELMSNIKGL